MKNIKLLIVGLILFLVAIILRSQDTLNSTITTTLLLIALIVTVVPLYNLVFKKLKK
jgi:uncharacterized membrane protein